MLESKPEWRRSFGKRRTRCAVRTRAAKPIAELVARCRARPRRTSCTCARGSSAHAATFGKHLIERHLGIPVAAAPEYRDGL